MTRRILVARSPLRAQGDRRPRAVPCRVAVSFWNAPVPVMNVIVKATASFRGEGAVRQARWVEARPFKATSAIDGEDRPLPDDFVPVKRFCDVLVVGNVEVWQRPSGEIPPRHGIIRVGDGSHSFTVHSATPARYPLRPPYVVSSAGGDARVGARPTPDHLKVLEHEDGFDYSVYQAGHPNLRRGYVGTGAKIVIEGLVEGEDRLEVQLPEHGAQALCDWARDDAPSDVRLYMDTVTIDLDESLIDVVWRGYVYTSPNPRHDVDRVIVGWASDDDWRPSEGAEASFALVMSELPHGTFSYAWEMSDVLEGKEPPKLENEDLEMARYETLDQLKAPEMTLTLEEHAKISAALAEEREPRAQILKRHGFDEFTWGVEERALGEVLQTLPMTDEVEPAQQAYARHFVAAQDALARPEDDRFRPQDYVEVAVGLEVDDPKKVLKDYELTLGAWMRIDRKWQNRIDADPKLAAEIDALFRDVRARRGERPEPKVDEDGRISP
jgi:hypothetical protein